ncbi:MAG: hypothetical protein ACRBFS_07960 [Aureispira sp.]
MPSHETENLVRLIVRFTHSRDGSPYAQLKDGVYKKLSPQRLNNLEHHLSKFRSHWHHGFVVPAGGSLLKLWYYHPDRIVNRLPERLSLEEYIKTLAEQGQIKGNYSLWLVPTTTYKLNTNKNRFPTVAINHLEELPTYFNQDVLRIDVYQNRVKVGVYDRKGYKTLTPSL